MAICPQPTCSISIPFYWTTLHLLMHHRLMWFIEPTFRLEPKQRITSAFLAASVAPFQLRGCSNVPRSPKCTIVSLSSPPQWMHLRSVPWRWSDVRSVTSNKRTYSLTGEQDVHTWGTDTKPACKGYCKKTGKTFQDFLKFSYMSQNPKIMKICKNIWDM